MTDQELIELNHKVAAIAGWKNITVWQPERNLPIKSYVGVNPNHPELGQFIPNYVEDLNTIAKVFDEFRFEWSVASDGYAFLTSRNELISEELAETPAIALCKLLVAISPDLIKPQTKPEIVEAVFG